MWFSDTESSSESEAEEFEDEEEDTGLTMEEFLAQKKMGTKKPELDLPTERKPGEGEHKRYLFNTVLSPGKDFEQGIDIRDEADEVAEFGFKDRLVFRPSLSSEVIKWAPSNLKGRDLPRLIGHTATVVGTGQHRRIFIFGGYSEEESPGAIFIINPFTHTITERNFAGVNPGYLSGHTATWAPNEGKLIVIGGNLGRTGALPIRLFNWNQESEDGYWGDKHKGNPPRESEKNRETWHNRAAPTFQRPSTIPESKYVEWCGCDDQEKRFSSGGNPKHNKYYRNNYFYPPNNLYYKEHYENYLIENEKEFPPVSHHSATLIATRIWVFGGHRGMTRTNDMFSIDLYPANRNMYYSGPWDTHYRARREAIRWEKIKLKGMKGVTLIPEPRAAHTATKVGHHIYVIGGKDGKIEYGDLWIFDTKEYTWEKAKLNGAYLPPIYNHSTVLVGDHLLIFGGFNRNKSLNHIFLIHTKSHTVGQLAVGGTLPVPRGSHAVALVDENMYLFGGLGEDQQKLSDCFTLERVFDTNGFISSLGDEIVLGLNNPFASDVVFEFPFENEKQIYAHKVLLAARSTVFREMFSNVAFEGKKQTDEVTKINIQDGEYDHWLRFLTYVYSDSVELDASSASKVMVLAKRYNLHQLEIMCLSAAQFVVIPPSTYISDLEWTFNNKQFSDLWFEVEGKVIYGHRVIAAYRSPVFKSMLSSSFKEAEQRKIVLENVDYEGFLEILKYVVTDAVSTNPQVAYDLLCHANLYGMKNLQLRCEAFLLDYVDESNACLLLECGSLYGADELRQAAFNYIVKNYHVFINSPEFQGLSPAVQKPLSEAIQARVKSINSANSFTFLNTNANAAQVKKENCGGCSHPFLYKPKEWTHGKMPKEMLLEWMSVNKPKSVMKCDPIKLEQGHIGHFSRCTLTMFDAEKDRSFESRTNSKNKKDSEQNAALTAFHAVSCKTSY